jgi:outer membrane protein TolC
LRQAELAESLLARQVRKEITVAVGDLSDSQQRLRQPNVGTTAAEEALSETEAAYKSGAGIYLAVLVAQDKLLSAQLDAISESLNGKYLYLVLLRSVGQLDTVISGFASKGEETTESHTINVAGEAAPVKGPLPDVANAE